MLSRKIFVTYVVVIICICFKYCNCSIGDEQLNAIETELGLLSKNIANEYFLDGKEFQYLDATRSCMACLSFTLDNLKRRVVKFLNLRADYRKRTEKSISERIELPARYDAEYGTKDLLVQAMDLVRGTYEIRKKFCTSTGFPTDKSMSSYIIGDPDVNNYCELFKNVKDLKDGSSEDEVMKCYFNYMAVDVDKNVAQTMANMFQSYKTEVTNLIDSATTTHQKYCYGCINEALQIETEQISKITSSFPETETIHFVKNGYALKKHYENLKKKCESGKPTSETDNITDYFTVNKVSKDQLILNGDVTKLKLCVEYYVADTDDELKKQVFGYDKFLNSGLFNFFPVGREMVFEAAEHSCRTCVARAISILKYHTNKLIDKRSEIRTTDSIPVYTEIDSSKIDENVYGNLQVFKAVHTNLGRNFDTWLRSCKNGFPNESFIILNSINNQISYSQFELFKNPKDLKEGLSDNFNTQVENCLNSYIIDQVDKATVHEIIPFIYEYKAEVDALVANDQLPAYKQNCYGCLQLTMDDQVDAIPIVLKSYPLQPSLRLVKNIYSFKKKFDEFKTKCENGVNKNPDVTIGKNHYVTAFTSYKGKWLDYGAYTSLMNCITYYVR